jgi:hypothetical protein
VFGKVTKGTFSEEIQPDTTYGINTLIENNRTIIHRPAYFHGSMGVPPVSLVRDSTGIYEAPKSIEEIERDSLYNGILETNLDTSKVQVSFPEQMNLAKSMNFNVYSDPFIHSSGIIRDRPYTDYNFSNPFASGTIISGDYKYDAFVEFMKVGFNLLNATNELTFSLNSGSKQLLMGVTDPETNVVYEVELDSNEIQRFNNSTFDSIYTNYINNSERTKVFKQPKETLPYAELLEIPKRIVNQYKVSYNIELVDDVETLVKTNNPTENSITVDLIEVGRLEKQRLITELEEVQHNALFVNTCILKYWEFKDLNPVLPVNDYIDNDKYPVYPTVSIDNSLVGTEDKDVVLYSVIKVTEDLGSKYNIPVYGARAFNVNASIDLANNRVVITLPEDLHTNVIADIQESIDGIEVLDITLNEFATFDIMYGMYNEANGKITYEPEYRTVNINLDHKTTDEIIVFYKHHLKYIEWFFKVDLGKVTYTTVPYPVVFDDKMVTGFRFKGAQNSNFGHIVNVDYEIDTAFKFHNAVAVQVIRYNDIRFENYIDSDWKFVNATVRQVIRYSDIRFENYINSGFEFNNASVKKVIDYIVYPNYDPEYIDSSFRFESVEVKKVKLDLD